MTTILAKDPSNLRCSGSRNLSGPAEEAYSHDADGDLIGL